MPTPECLLSIAAEGGSIEIFRDCDVPNSGYRAMVVDQTPTFLDERERDAPSRRDSGWLPTWGAAIEWVGRYPWPNLVCRYAPPHLPRAERVPVRMPSPVERERLEGRDGLHCRFCGIPLIRREVRERIRRCYPMIWGRKNDDQHAAFQAMWLQYDHVLPHAQGGDNSFENLVITCAPCNYSRMDFTLDELGLRDPRDSEPVRSSWTGLERFRGLDAR